MGNSGTGNGVLSSPATRCTQFCRFAFYWLADRPNIPFESASRQDGPIKTDIKIMWRI